MADATTDFTQTLPTKISANTEATKEINAVFLFEIDGDNGGTWTVDCKDNPGVVEGDAGQSDCTIKMNNETWKELFEAPGSAMKLYFTGKLKVTGNTAAALKLPKLLEN